MASMLLMIHSCHQAGSARGDPYSRGGGVLHSVPRRAGYLPAPSSGLLVPAAPSTLVLGARLAGGPRPPPPMTGSGFLLPGHIHQACLPRERGAGQRVLMPPAAPPSTGSSSSVRLRKVMNGSSRIYTFSESIARPDESKDIVAKHGCLLTDSSIFHSALFHQTSFRKNPTVVPIITFTASLLREKKG